MSTALPLTSHDLGRTLDFWENGHVRQILETEFETVLDRELSVRRIAGTGHLWQLLHDAIVPEVFLYVTRNIEYTPKEERELAFTLLHEKILRRELESRIGVQLDRYEECMKVRRMPRACALFTVMARSIVGMRH